MWLHPTNTVSLFTCYTSFIRAMEKVVIAEILHDPLVTCIYLNNNMLSKRGANCFLWDLESDIIMIFSCSPLLFSSHSQVTECLDEWGV